MLQVCVLAGGGCGDGAVCARSVETTALLCAAHNFDALSLSHTCPTSVYHAACCCPSCCHPLSCSSPQQLHCTHTRTAGRRWGAFFGGDGRLLAAQIVALLVTMLWVALFFIPYFALMRHLNVGRVPIEQELAGLDASKYSLMTTNELPTAHKPKQKMYV